MMETAGNDNNSRTQQKSKIRMGQQSTTELDELAEALREIRLFFLERPLKLFSRSNRNMNAV
jgi:hypothetical protein